MLFSYLDLKFDVVHAADNAKQGNGSDIRLVTLGPIALFKNFRLTSGTGKHLEDVIHAHVVSLLLK